MDEATFTTERIVVKLGPGHRTIDLQHHIKLHTWPHGPLLALVLDTICVPLQSGCAGRVPRGWLRVGLTRFEMTQLQLLGLAIEPLTEEEHDQWDLQVWTPQDPDFPDTVHI
jgi:hypothetical protein